MLIVWCLTKSHDCTLHNNTCCIWSLNSHFGSKSIAIFYCFELSVSLPLSLARSSTMTSRSFRRKRTADHLSSALENGWHVPGLVTDTSRPSQEAKAVEKALAEALGVWTPAQLACQGHPGPPSEKCVHRYSKSHSSSRRRSGDASYKESGASC